jgi:hypothetical protein
LMFECLTGHISIKASRYKCTMVTRGLQKER